MGDLDPLIGREVAAINQKLTDHGVDAGTCEDWTLVAGGAFISYGLGLGRAQKISVIEGLLDDLAIVLSGVRLAWIRERVKAGKLAAADARDLQARISGPVRLRLLPAPALEVAHPAAYPLHWLKARGVVDRLPALHMLAGRSYSSMGSAEEIVSLIKSPHTLIAGMTQSGKSTLMQMMVLSLACSTPPADLEFWFVDLKNADLVALQRLPHVAPGAVAVDRAGAGALVRRLHDLKDQRVHTGRAGGAWSGRRVVLVVDELAELAPVPGLLDLLGSIVSVGAAMGIHVIAATQYPIAKVIGGIAKANFTDRFAGRVADGQQASVAAGRPGTGAELLPGFGSFLRVSGLGVIRLQSYLLDAAGIDHFMREARPAWQAARERMAGAASGPASTALAVTRNVSGVPASAPPALPGPVAPALPPGLAAVFGARFDASTGGLRRPGTVEALRCIYGDGAPVSGRSYQAGCAEVLRLLQLWVAAGGPGSYADSGADVVNMRAWAGGRASAAGGGD